MAAVKDRPNVPADMTGALTKTPPMPRVIDPSSRIRPGPDEIHAHESHRAMGFKQPPATQYRKDSDYPDEAALGWKRFLCRGVDNIILGEVLRVREHVWPIYFILAPDREAAEKVYREQIREDALTIGRKEKQIEVVIEELGD